MDDKEGDHDHATGLSIGGSFFVVLLKGTQRMDTTTALNILSAIGGMIRTALLYAGSFAYEAPAVYMNQQMVDDMLARNKRRQTLQRTGLVFLFAGFLLQCIAPLLMFVLK